MKKHPQPNYNLAPGEYVDCGPDGEMVIRQKVFNPPPELTAAEREASLRRASEAVARNMQQQETEAPRPTPRQTSTL